jgi:tetrahydromethanopterin S-methyltransferase subunit A
MKRQHPQTSAGKRHVILKKVDVRSVRQIKAHYTSSKEWRADPKGYFVIKVFYDKGYFGARFHSYNHVPQCDIIGIDAEAIAQTIIREGFISSLQHAAYLGHELQKAETALKLRIAYVQDAALNYHKKTKSIVSDNII